MAALLDDDNISTISNKVPPLAQVMKQDCIFSMCPNSTNTSYEDQCMISSALNMPTSENINGPCEEMLWSGLWNLDDNNRASFDGNGANINVRARNTLTTLAYVAHTGDRVMHLCDA
ncbi:hypothetical protein Sjap_006156 [Stephania japonica]|uniref:Uncharacterized protein n=1 Tax=Stephania japonica TaxID=461633 RepID=A0AAP0K6V7_9MAGN